MPSPYTIDEASAASGLSVKFIRRMKEALPVLFEKHTERGAANALLFDETILEVLKQTRELRSRGRTLQQIRDELASLSGKSDAKEKSRGEGESNASTGLSTGSEGKEGRNDSLGETTKASLERENVLLRSQVTLLQTLLQKAEERFDRLLPARTKSTEETTPMMEKGPNMKSQLLLWLVEAVVVTAFASGFIFLIWFFAQKAFST
jgi:DNA-binding transcriptional MerR regulator